MKSYPTIEYISENRTDIKSDSYQDSIMNYSWMESDIYTRITRVRYVQVPIVLWIITYCIRQVYFVSDNYNIKQSYR